MSTRKVLIIEDDHKLNLALSLRLKNLGHQVIQAHDGVQAALLAARYGPDLILMDISLPGQDGFAVAESIRKDPLTAQVPLIFLTASKKQGLRERALGLGAAGFLEKPFAQEEIQKAIDLALAP